MSFHGIFHIGKKENFRYNYHSAQKKLWIGSVVVCVIILVLTGILRYAQTTDLALTLMKTLPYAVGGAVLLFGVNLLAMYLNIRRVYSKRTVSEFTQELTLDSEGVHAASQTGRTDLPWKQLHGITESKKDFYLYLNPATAFVIPKDQLADTNDAETIRRICKTFAGKSQLKLLA